MIKPFFIMNPGSRSGQSRRKFDLIMDQFSKRGIPFIHRFTESLNHATELTFTANEQGYDPIVAVGGDGTINAVINGFFDNEGKNVVNSRFGIIYTGTSPDFCKSYEIPTNMFAALQTIIAEKTRKIPIGKVKMIKSSPDAVGNQKNEVIPSDTGFFGCCANIGLGAALARMANSGIRKYIGDHAGTFASLLWILSHHSPVDCKVVIDDEETLFTKVYNISVGRTPLIASGIKVNHFFEDDDKSLYVLVLRNMKWNGIIPVLRQIYGDKPIQNSQQLQLLTGTKISIDPLGKNLEVEFDGDPHGYAPCMVELAADPLEVLVG